ncbi:MAG: CHRD domain-containing protein [Planctomycetota bacterium]
MIHRAARRALLLTSAVLLVTSTAGAQVASYSSSLDGTKVVPPVPTSGTGSASWCFDTQSKLMVYTVTVEGLLGAPTIAHIHDGAPGIAGPPLFPLTMTTSGSSSATWAGTVGPFDAATEAKLVSGALHVKVHSSAFPPGELRDQLDAAPVAGVETPRTSQLAPFNPPVLAPMGAPGPVVGATYTPTADRSQYDPPLVGPVLESVAVSLSTATPELPLGSDGSWLLCGALPPDPVAVLVLEAAAPPVPVSIAIPSDCELIGLSACVQAVAVDLGTTPAGIRFGNALDLVVGTL